MQRFGLSSIRVYVWLTILLISLCWLQELVRFPFNHDNGSILDAGQRLLDGETLYTDYPEPNPPLIFLCAEGVSVIARIFGSDPMITWRLCFLFLVTTIFGFSAYLLSKAEWDFSQTGPQGFLWILLALFFPFSGYDFSQRDHLVVVMAFPYFLVSATRENGTSVSLFASIVSGILAGIGFSFKPFFLLVFCCIQLFLTISLRRKGQNWIFPEALAISVVSGGFLAWVVLGTSYLQFIKFLQPFYSSYNATLLQIFLSGNLLPLCLAFIMSFFFKPTLEEKGLRPVLFLSAFVFSLIYIIQLKGWFYHALPSQILSYSMIGLIILGMDIPANPGFFFQRLRRFKNLYILLFIFFYISFGTAKFAFHPLVPFRGSKLMELITEMRELEAGKKAHLLSCQCFPIFPAMNYLGVRSTQRNYAFLLPKLFGTREISDSPFLYELDSDLKPTAQFYTDATVKDLISRKPDYVISDEQYERQALGISKFNFIEFLSRDPAFKKIFETNYVFLKKAAGFSIYRRIN